MIKIPQSILKKTKLHNVINEDEFIFLKNIIDPKFNQKTFLDLCRNDDNLELIKILITHEIPGIHFLDPISGYNGFLIACNSGSLGINFVLYNLTLQNFKGGLRNRIW